MLDITSPSACFLLSHLHKSCLIISPRLAVVDTFTSYQIWGEAMTQIWQIDPTNAAIKLRLRDSDTSRSKKCAEVQTTSERIAAARARKGHKETEPDPNKPETLRATIDMPIPVEAQIDSWLPTLMEHIGQIGGVILSQQAAPTGMEMGTWKAMLDFEGGWTGKVLIQCRNKMELYKLHRAVQNKGITIQGHNTSININSNYVDLGNYLSVSDF